MDEKYTLNLEDYKKIAMVPNYIAPNYVVPKIDNEAGNVAGLAIGSILDTPTSSLSKPTVKLGGTVDMRLPKPIFQGHP